MGENAAIGAMVGGGVMSGTSSILAGFQQKEIAEWNAMVARRQAEDAKLRGEENASVVRLQGRQLIGSMRAALGARGQDLSRGTALRLQLDAARMTEIDAQTTLNNAAREAWGYRVQAVNSQNAGRMAVTQGIMGGVSSAIDTGFSAYTTKRYFDSLKSGSV